MSINRHSITPDLVRGVLEVEPTDLGVRLHRLPAWARAQVPDPGLLSAESQPSGARLVFTTTASVVELEALPTKRQYVGAPLRPDGVHELVVDGEVLGQGVIAGGRVVTLDMMTGAAEVAEGPAGRVRFEGLPAGEKTVELWLPHDESTELVALHTDAPIAPAPPATGRTWLHHGSSISHGSAATHPRGTWPAVAAVAAGVELVNLGFGGNALLDPAVARVLRDVPADVISVKLGINLVNQDLMRRRAFGPAVHGFLDTVRDGHPDTPLLVVSPILCPIHEDLPGPTLPDLTALAEGRVSFVAGGSLEEVAQGKLSLGVVREVLAEVVAQRADPHLGLLDGRELYGAADAAELPLPDGLHPDTATHQRMGERFAALALGPDGVLG